MNVIIADSGSTKCDWARVNEKGQVVETWETMGFNPYFHTTEMIEQKLKEVTITVESAQIDAVFFYGSGCSSHALNQIVEKALCAIYTNAKVKVDHDALGAAYATYTGEPAITCILGTGSNSSYFDGETVSEEVPSLAYIVGDEASGSYFGKDLLRAYFYRKLDSDLRIEFEKKYGVLDKDAFIHRVYNEPHANVYLASFTQFLGDHISHPQVLGWLKQGMSEFLDLHVLCFKNAREVPIHFIGSVAYHFQEVLKEALLEKGLHLGQIIQKPIDGLVHYHNKYFLA